MITWKDAFKKSFNVACYAILWSILGIVIVYGGIYMMTQRLWIVGIVMYIIGGIVAYLGVFASIFKVIGDANAISKEPLHEEKSLEDED